MPAQSEKQRMMMAIAEHHPEALYKRNRGVLKMSKSDLSDFASTRFKGHRRGTGGGGGSPTKYRRREGGMGDCY